MSLDVKILGKITLGGGMGGHTTGGVAKNEKVLTWGELTGDYVTGGVDFVVADVGLTGTVDFISFQEVTMIDAGTVGLIEDDTSIRAQFSEPDGQIIMQTVDNAGTATESTQTAYVVNFLALGDSAAVAELL